MCNATHSLFQLTQSNAWDKSKFIIQMGGADRQQFIHHQSRCQ